MAYLVFAIIMVVIILGGAVGYLFTKDKLGVLVAVGGVAVLGAVSFIWSITSVDSRSVGIQTSFNRYQGTLDSGFQLTAPWTEHEDFTTRIQYLDLDGEKWSDGAPVTFKGGGRGVVFATPRWKIDEDSAGKLWNKYKTFDNVRDQLVRSSVKDSFRAVLTGYTPNEARENVREITMAVEKDLAKTLTDDGIKIDSISIKDIKLDDRTQSSLDKIVQANNDIERARAEQERAKIDAETLKIKEKAGNLSDGGLMDKCLTMMDKWDVKKNGNLPAGFSCNGSGAPFTVTNK
ncbi:band-7-like membrane protein [Streptomyces phage Wofford]|uniref:Band-7-like membrane protein n=1 Tax=Streptomyces phage Wofford TaxID=2283267 RepID=A0A345M9Z5_9CAUD|nr:band-7-like membrane protein [Streptomyces phage Wollford]AXH67316.1 band-7-like membrane protein [Streptomyces phage Wollford]